jgi:zinc protease
MTINRIVAVGLALTHAASLASAQAIPDNPEKLTYAPLAYTPPAAKDYRVVLKNGIVAYIVEDRALPLVNISVTVRAGAWLEPAGKEGLARLTGSQMRAGGTKSLTAEQFDEKADFLAAQIGSSMGDTSGGASLNCLADNLDDSLKLFLEMLREPRYQEDRLKLAKEQILQDMKKRNDESADIENRELSFLVYGEDHFSNRYSTEASVNSITPADLKGFHDMYYYPANFILAVSGAFSKADMVKKLEAAFANWPSPKRVIGAIPPGIKPAAPGIYRMNKDVNQGRVSVAIPSVLRTSPDIYALEVMNEILGGSGFTSRITKTVRSNEGLAYSAGSGIGFGAYYPGRFRASFQSKSSTVAYALQLVFQEIRKIRDTPVTEEELVTIKNNLIQTFPSNFESKAQQAGTFAADEYTKRDPLFWSTYRDKIQAVTAADVQRVAKQYLIPEKMITLVVGNQLEISKGDGKHDITLEKLAGGAGKITDLTLRDPMTMKRK